MPSKIVTVGITAVKLLEWNDYRTQATVTMLPTTQIAANSGRVHVGIGLVPTPTPGDPNQGNSLAQSDRLGFTEAYPGDPAVPKNEIWGIASIAGQVLEVFEEVYDPTKPTRAIPVRDVGRGA
jgi:hypothetical protein